MAHPDGEEGGGPQAKCNMATNSGNNRNSQSSGVVGQFLDSLKRSSPRSDLSGAQQPTPFGLNRYILLAVYALQTFATGCVYFGWAPLSSMIYSVQGLSSHCRKDNNGLFIDDMRNNAGEAICDEQDAAVQQLYTICFAVHCAVGALAGTIMDIAGPKLTSTLGQAFHIIGWSLIASMAQNEDYKLYLGFIFIGMGADTAFLPTLLITRLFPGKESLIITILGAASSASFLIPLILEWSVTDLTLNCVWWYVGFGPVLFLIVDALLMPLKAFTSYSDALANNSDTVDANQVDHPGSEQENSLRPDATRLQSYGAKSKPSRCGCTSSFFDELLSERYALIVLYFVGVGWLTSYYQQAHSRLLPLPSKKLLKWILPLSFIPCIIQGKFADKYGILPIMFFLNTCAVAMYLLAYWFIVVTGCLSVIFFTIYISLFVSQVFIYIEGTFSAAHFGRLAGIAQLAGGLLSLVCDPIYYYVAIRLGSVAPPVTALGMLGIAILQYGLIYRMYYLWRKSPSRQKADLLPPAAKGNQSGPV